MSVQFLKSNNSKGFVIDRPGYVMAIPILANGQLDWQNAKRNVAAINTITVTNTRTKTNIPDGNSFYPAGDRVTDLSGTLAIEFSTYDPTFWAMASGTGELQEKTGYYKIYPQTIKIDVTNCKNAEESTQLVLENLKELVSNGI